MDTIELELEDPEKTEGEIFQEEMAVVKAESKKVVAHGQRVAELARGLTDLEKAFAEKMVYGRPKSQKEALRAAGSKAKDRYLAKLASEMALKPTVKEYMEALKGLRSEESAIELDEVIKFTRDCIKMAMANEKPKDAEGHIRLLAELGGYIKNSSSGANGAGTTINNNLALGATFKSESVDEDFKRLKTIISS